MTPSERQNEEREARKQRILKGALEVFKASGLEGATMDQIAQNSGFGKATLYYYFKSKEEVLIAALDDVAILIGQELRDQRVKANNLEEFVSFQVKPFFEFAQDHSDIFMILNSNLNDVQSLSLIHI